MNAIMMQTTEQPTLQREAAEFIPSIIVKMAEKLATPVTTIKMDQNSLRSSESCFAQNFLMFFNIGA